MNKDNLLFYDIEVFKYDSLVVFKTIENVEIAHFWSIYGFEGINGFEGVEQVIKDKTLVGYNNHYYDDSILYDMKTGKTQDRIKVDNDTLIAGETILGMRDNLSRDPVLSHTLDCFQQIDVAKPSLKKIEGNMGRSVLESEIPFDIDRPLTAAERETVLTYCRYDVENTIEVFKLRESSYFDIRDALLGMIGDDKVAGKKYKLNTTTLSAYLLLGNKTLVRWSDLRLNGKDLSGVPAEVAEMWSSVKAYGENDSEKSITIDKYGCSITFGFGGLHGVYNGQKRFQNVKLLDVGSMYPSIITLLNALGDEGTKIYDGMRQERLRIKHTDPVRAGALKLILNSVYGNLKNQYSQLRNPMAALSVCVYGQMALYDLCGKLDAAGYQVMNINTDGVGFTDPNGVGDAWQQIQSDWEADWGLYLELDEFDGIWIQKDVNNYVAQKGSKIKTKGGDLNKYHEPKFFSNNNARIIHIMIVEYLINKKPLLDTCMEHWNEPELFQYILQAGRTYDGVVDQDGVKYQNVNRVFAVHDGVDGAVQLYKLRKDGGKVSFPDMPERYRVWNDEVSKYPHFKKDVDLNHYIKIARKKLEAWE